MGFVLKTFYGGFGLTSKVLVMRLEPDNIPEDSFALD
jgi:hypothetical protein